MKTITATLNPQSLAYIIEKVETLAKRAAKINQQPPTLEMIGKETATYRDSAGHQTPVIMTTVRITAAPVYITGYHLAAILDHTAGEQNHVIELTDKGVSPIFRKAPPACAHCNTNRNRYTTYLIEDEAGRLKQIGSTCLKDFTDHTNPAEIADYLDGITRLYEEADRDYREELRTGSRTSDRFIIKTFLAACLLMIDQYGYTSRTKARETFTQATADKAALYLEEGNTPTPVYMQEAQRIQAEAAALLTEKASRQELSTFEHDTLNLILEDNEPAISAKWQYNGFIAYVPVLKQKLDEENRRREAETESRHIGKIKDRITFEARYIDTYSFETEWGLTHIHKFITEGNVITWKTGTGLPTLAGQQPVTITATIKAHTNYKGIDQTAVTRAKVEAQES